MMQLSMAFIAGQARLQILALPTHRLCYISSQSLSWILELGGLDEVRPENVLNLRFSIIIWEPGKRGQPAAFHPFIGELDLCFL